MAVGSEPGSSRSPQKHQRPAFRMSRTSLFAVGGIFGFSFGRLTFPSNYLMALVTERPKAVVAQAKTAEAEAAQADEPSLPLLQDVNWCPDAKCHNSDLCHPCQRRFLIVITSPRSASTTLTWMLDSLPGVTMSGENNNALGKIKTMQDGIVNVKNMQGKDGTGIGFPWKHHKVVDQSLSCVSQSMIRSINPPMLNEEDGHSFADPQLESREIVGFKTIRFFQGVENKKQEAEMADWLKTDFPCSRIIVNVNSDVQGGAKSWKKYERLSTPISQIEESITKHTEKLKRLAARLGEKQAYLLDKVQWTSGDLKYLNDAVQWMGFHKSCHFQELLEFNIHGYKHGRTTIKPFNETCQPL